MSHDSTICVGIDIASRKFDVEFSHENTVETFDYNKKGTDRFIKLFENKLLENKRAPKKITQASPSN